MNQSVVWSMMSVQRDRQVGNALDSLRAAVESMPEGPNRAAGADGAAAGDKTVGPVDAAATGAGAASHRHPRRARSAPRPATPMPDPGQALFRGGQERAARRDARPQPADESRAGRVADRRRARQRRAAAAGQVLSDSITIVLRVKGSDLAIYHADPTKRDEIRAEGESRSQRVLIYNPARCRSDASAARQTASSRRALVPAALAVGCRARAASPSTSSRRCRSPTSPAAGSTPGSSTARTSSFRASRSAFASRPTSASARSR